MLRSGSPALLLIASLALLPACATQSTYGPVNPDQVAIHESVVSAPPRYDTIKRLWVNSWTSAFGTTSYSSREDAMADFRHQAASRGGNGVINFNCYQVSDNGRLVCNGTVVRFL